MEFVWNESQIKFQVIATEFREFKQSSYYNQTKGFNHETKENLKSLDKTMIKCQHWSYPTSRQKKKPPPTFLYNACVGGPSTH